MGQAQKVDVLNSYVVGDDNIFQILKKRWWKYLLLGLVDVEANYAVVKAYQYTTITSIQVGVARLLWFLLLKEIFTWIY